MEGKITHFRQGRHHTSPNQMIVKIENIEDKKTAQDIVGKTVTYNTGKKEIKGKVSGAHGNKGTVRVLFETGMPGQAIGKKVQIK